MSSTTPFLKSIILFFFILISYQLILALLDYNNQTIEGLENYQEYDKNDVMILAKQNAGNIEVLRKSVDDLSGLKQEVRDIQSDIVHLNSQVDDLVQAQQSYLNENMPSKPPEITGALDDKEKEKDTEMK